VAERIAMIRSFLRGSWGAELHPDFPRSAADFIVQEHGLHVGTDLDLLLRARGIERLVICVLRANTCVDGTARYAVEIGRHVTIASDSTAAFRCGLRPAPLAQCTAMGALISEVSKTWSSQNTTWRRVCVAVM
jgi:nicotinamidase-related amidase